MLIGHCNRWPPIDLNFAMYVASAFRILPDEPPFVSDGLWVAINPPAIPEAERLLLVQDWRQMVSDHAQNARAQDEAFFADDRRPSYTWENQDFRSPYFVPNDQFENLPRRLPECCNTVLPVRSGLSTVGLWRSIRWRKEWHHPGAPQASLRHRSVNESMCGKDSDCRDGEIAGLSLHRREALKLP